MLCLMPRVNSNSFQEMLVDTKRQKVTENAVQELSENFDLQSFEADGSTNTLEMILE